MAHLLPPPPPKHQPPQVYLLSDALHLDEVSALLALVTAHDERGSATAEAAAGVITVANAKSPGDPAWDNDAGMQAYFAWAKKWAPELNPNDSFVSAGYTYGIIVAHLLRQCGDQLTRENLMRHAASMKGYATPLTLPGVTLDTSPSDYLPYQTLRLQQFDGTSYKLIGDVLRE